jgi:transposase
VAEIGDVTRFGRPEQLCSWAGLTPRHHESDTTVHRGRPDTDAPDTRFIHRKMRRQ